MSLQHCDEYNFSERKGNVKAGIIDLSGKKTLVLGKSKRKTKEIESDMLRL
jgi:hypothetical protein